MNSLYSFWKFSRPHTIIGTSLSVLALYFIALATTNSAIAPNNFLQMLAVLAACLCGNVYIVGLNQICDVAIDRINKPHLPLAAKEFSPRQGQWIVGVTGILALILAGTQGLWLLATVGISLLIGTAYSLPPIRLKQFPLLAAFCIFTVRGVIVNLGLFLHFTKKLAGREFLNGYVWVLTLFIIVFTVAIAIFKDVPDLEGDKKYNITTFTIILGKSAVFSFSRWLITCCYLGMVIAAFYLAAINTSFFIAYHLVLLILLWWRSRQVDLSQKSAIADFYQFIWKLFFLEYILFPTACFI
ncbi:homogentisate phytyltransferase [Myxosarcina sp. GI1]|uniref:homogentisate phytyltransferase n=1 Tax=Myxosarcina sp. GI1 TaxID=1541065 RepID=UPI0005627776|nr:homogentisate phytyltransferase [Myxosarcina sp. GI1]